MSGGHNPADDETTEPTTDQVEIAARLGLDCDYVNPEDCGFRRTLDCCKYTPKQTTTPTLREQFIDDGTLAVQSWDDWKRDLVACATAHDMAGIDPDSYRDFYDDGYTPEDAWNEDQLSGI